MKQLTGRIDASTHRGSEHYKLISPGLVRMQFQVASQCRGLNVGPDRDINMDNNQLTNTFASRLRQAFNKALPFRIPSNW